MSTRRRNRSRYFDRIRGQVNVSLLGERHVVVVGLGTVGSPVAEYLAKDGVGSFLFIDGDTYEEVNRVRHVLPYAYLGVNKAEAMRDYLLSEHIPGLQVEALPRFVDDAMSDIELDTLLEHADLIIAGTGETDVQRRLGRRALSLDIPAIFPGLMPDAGGEVFIQTSPESPCFLCRDSWRQRGEPVRGAEALGVEAMPVIQTTIELSLGVLDPNSRYDELTLPDENDQDQRERQLFMLFPGAPRLAETVERRDNCPSCAVGPSPLNPEARQAWEAAQRPRRTVRIQARPPVVEPTKSSWRRQVLVAIGDIFTLIGGLMAGIVVACAAALAYGLLLAAAFGLIVLVMFLLLGAHL